MKKLFCLFLVLAMLASLIPAALAEEIVLVDPEAEDGPIAIIDPEAAAQPEATLPVGELQAADGTCGDRLTWHLADGTLTISGTGPMWDLGDEYPSWHQYRKSIMHVVIKHGATNISARAFGYCSLMLDISIPDSVTTIGERAFEECESLKEVSIPGSVTLIGFRAFYGCRYLMNIEIAPGVTAIHDNAFTLCQSLEEIILPNTLQFIGNEAFSLCRALRHVVIPASVTRIDSKPFLECELLNSVGPVGGGYDLEYGWTKEIPEKAFSELSSMKSLALPSGLRTIGKSAFSNCRNLKSVIIPDSVKTIGESAFAGCSMLQDAALGNGVKTIGPGAFQSCRLDTLTIPASVTEIGDYCFVYSYWLKTLIFEGSAPNLGTDIFHYLTLTAYYPADDASWTSRVRKDYGGTVTWTPYTETPMPGPGSEDPWIIYEGNCGSNLKWTFDDRGVLTISGSGEMDNYSEYSGSKAPWREFSFDTVIIGEKVTSIGEYAFYQCNSLKQVKIPQNVKKIGQMSFAYCSSLSEFQVDPKNTNFLSIDGVLFYRDEKTLFCYPGGRPGAYTIPDSVETVFGLAFRGCEGLSAVTVPDSVKTLGYYVIDNLAYCDSVFMDCINLREAVIGSGVKELCGSCFSGCVRLESVSLPDGLTSIGRDAFYNCAALKSIHIPDTATSLGELAFFGCISLNSVTLPEGLTVVSGGLFDECRNLSQINLPQSVTTIGGTAFGYCKQLASIELPKNVKEIQNSAFVCSGLTEITLPAKVASIEATAFSGCAALQEIRFEGSAPTIGNAAFAYVRATAYYPGNDSTWKKSVRQDYGGKITWVAYLEQPAPELQAGGQSTAGVALGWTAVEGADSYELQRRIDGGDWKSLTKAAETAFTDAGARMGVKNFYRVRAVAGSAVTAWSDELEVFFNPFTDVSGKKTIEYVAWAYNNDIVRGTTETTFSPDKPCTRIQFVMMLWKMHGSPVVEGTNPFSDISGKKTTNAILWALDKGVINASSRFDPDGNISRVQIVMILWKLAGSPVVEGENPFVDVSGSKTTKAVLWAYQNGITKGTSDTTFAPDKDCTRVQLVVFLYKYNGIYQVI